MISTQEELDWHTYHLYGLSEENLSYPETPPPVRLGQRAFEIVLARKIDSGDLDTYWFELHGAKPITEIPSHWPQDYQRLVQRRINAIESNKSIRIIEKPEYKRRWNTEPWEDQERRALRRWLLNRLETDGLWDDPRLTSTARLADRMRQDEDFLQVGAIYRAHEDFDPTKLVTELVQEEGVPYLAPHRYKASGLRKRKTWERVWDLQRKEDALDERTELSEDHPDHLSEKEAEERKAALGIPVPPKYRKSDFANGTVWRHRGKLDVPKEQFILYPGAEREADPTPVLGWAGWDHLERAEALATYYTKMRDTESWSKERLLPLLAGLLELLPWIKQWHNEYDPSLGEGMGDYYESFLEGEAHGHGVTLDDLKELEP